MHFKSEYEAYTYLLLKIEEIEKQLKNMNMQMDYLRMNIRKNNFNNEDKTGALQELGYLISGSQKLSVRAKEMEELATNLLDDLSQRESYEVYDDRNPENVLFSHDSSYVCTCFINQEKELKGKSYGEHLWFRTVPKNS
ncbi:hypothetical protein CHH80_03565 [Bacillus sp. 7504-2]|nr:hypothetical protein CHH80_03565 [Bacillus sp. 7504-2]